MIVAPINSIETKTFGNDAVKVFGRTNIQNSTKIFEKKNTEFFTFPTPAENSLKVVITGLTTDISKKEFTEEFILKGYEIIVVRQFVKARRLPLHLITLPNIPVIKTLFRESSFFYISIKIEPYRTTNPAQCFNCQRFSHSNLYCGYASRCVKCASPHKAKDCVKTIEETPKCINCDDSHTANFKKCPKFLRKTLPKKP